MLRTLFKFTAQLQNIETLDFDILVYAIVFPILENPRKHKKKIADDARNLVMGAREIQICSAILTVSRTEDNHECSNCVGLIESRNDCL